MSSAYLAGERAFDGSRGGVEVLCSLPAVFLLGGGNHFDGTLFGFGLKEQPKEIHFFLGGGGGGSLFVCRSFGVLVILRCTKTTRLLPQGMFPGAPSSWISARHSASCAFFFWTVWSWLRPVQQSARVETKEATSLRDFKNTSCQGPS